MRLEFVAVEMFDCGEDALLESVARGGRTGKGTLSKCD